MEGTRTDGREAFMKFSYRYAIPIQKVKKSPGNKVGDQRVDFKNMVKNFSGFENVIS